MMTINAIEAELLETHYHCLIHRFKRFRPRAVQKQMMQEVASTFSRSSETERPLNQPNLGESILLVEAPTGVGKSLAYLLPGIILAQKRNKQLIVSSATIALQHQLIHGDLPQLRQASNLSFSYCLVKGRNNYFCPYRAEEVGLHPVQATFLEIDQLDGELSSDQREKVKDILSNFRLGQFNGDKDSYKEMIPAHLWQKINNQKEYCLGESCPQKGHCPYLQLREQMSACDVIVVNHNVLLSDIALGGGVLLPSPSKSFYCIDEAHHFPAKAVQHFTAKHSIKELSLLLELLIKLAYYNLVQIPVTMSLAHQLMQKLDTFQQMIFLCRDFLYSQLNSSGVLQCNDSGNWIIELSAMQEKQWRIIIDNMDTLLTFLLHCLTEVKQLLIKEVKNSTTVLTSWSILSIALNLCEQIAALWHLFALNCAKNEKPVAKWLSFNKQQEKGEEKESVDITLHASLINVSRALVDRLWHTCAGAILTSATLRTLSSFDCLLEQTGLKELPLTHVCVLDSPFDLKKQAQFHVPAMRYSPKQVLAHTQEIIEYIPQLIDFEKATGTLFLFSSKKQLHQVYIGLDKSYQYHILLQGSMSVESLIKMHEARIQAGRASIVFGLSSFSEGIDLRGNLCTHVIIAKIPFAVPNNPIDQVYAAWLKQNERNYFYEVALPYAALRLGQAAGRLIRTETDYGRVTILDNRLLRTHYGTLLMQSFSAFSRVM